MSEKLFERKLRDKMKLLGGIAVKFTSPFYTGMPDRIVLAPGGQIWFAEIKSSGKSLSARQRVVVQLLTGLGMQVRIIDSWDSLYEFLNEVEHAVRTSQLSAVHNG